MALRSGGLASGLDTNSIVQQLVSIERQPINKLKRTQAGYSTQISKIGSIKSALMDLKTSMKTIDTQAEFLVSKATSSDEDFFTATSTGDASIASYDITVTQKASGEKDRSAAFTNSTSAVKAGSVSFTVKGGSAQAVTIDDGMTLAQLAGRINDEVTGLSASVVSGTTEARLIITADDTGHTIGGAASDAITIAENYSGASGTELGLTEFTAAANATMTIDGVSVESETNTVTEALSGVTFNVKKVTTQTETLSIAQDNDKIADNVQTFVDKYNTVIKLLNAELRVSAKTDRASTLAGDNSIRALSAALKKAVTNSVSSVSGNKYNALNTIGITNKNGVMSVDKTKLTEALDDKIQQVSDLFTVADGFATALNPIAEQYGAVDGLLADRIEGLNKSTRSIANRILKLEARVSKFETQLVRQFSSLEQAVAKLQQQGNFLAGSL